MNSLREKLIKAQEEETLRQFLEHRYDHTPPAEKQRILNLVSDQINRDIDRMIREEIDTYNENTPKKKKNKKVLILFGILNIILTLLGAYAINEEAWIFVVGLGVLLIVCFIAPLIIVD